MADFDDVVAVDRATAYARTYFDLARALRFLMTWGALRDAAETIVARADELNGRAAETPLWASRLATKWPEAAGLLLRARVKALLAMGARGAEVEALEAEVERWGWGMAALSSRLFAVPPGVGSFGVLFFHFSDEAVEMNFRPMNVGWLVKSCAIALYPSNQQIARNVIA